jgi:hypothetical protein
MDVLVPNSMKDAVNCDKQCELQKSVNHQTSERIWCCLDLFLQHVWLSVYVLYLNKLSDGVPIYIVSRHRAIHCIAFAPQEIGGFPFRCVVKTFYSAFSL